MKMVKGLLGIAGLFISTFTQLSFAAGFHTDYFRFSSKTCVIARGSSPATCNITFSWKTHQDTEPNAPTGTASGLRTLYVNDALVKTSSQAQAVAGTLISVTVAVGEGTTGYRLSGVQQKYRNAYRSTVTGEYPAFDPYSPVNPNDPYSPGFPHDSISASATHIPVQGNFNGDSLTETFHQPKLKTAVAGILPDSVNAYIDVNLHRNWSGAHPHIPQIKDWSAESYGAFAGNLSAAPGDELLLLGRKDIILLHGDIITPIVLLNDVKNAIVSWDANNIASITTFDFDADPDNYNVYMADLNGNGYMEILLQGKSYGSSLHILNNSGSLIQTLASGYKGLDWSGASYTLVIADINNDGRADIEMRSNIAGVPDNFAFANTSGVIDSVQSTHHRSESPKPATLVGSTGGEFRVNESGAATYSIGLKVPQGVAGVAPQLSLSYSSGSGNSVVGLGWNLGGLSAITRCPKNYEQNGEITAVNNNKDDRFCINGQQLFWKNSSVSNGSYNTEYVTEYFSNQVITSFNSDGNLDEGPDYFTVKGRDGDTHYYGQHNPESANALVHDSSLKVNRMWLLERTEDLAGNSIRYQYAQTPDKTEVYLDKVLYADNQVDFVYADELDSQFERSDSSDGYSAGSKVAMSKLLKLVKVTTADLHVRTYQIYHQVSAHGEYQLVKAIQECSYQGNCLEAVNFDWSEPVRYAATESISFSLKNPVAGELKSVDINGNGISDFLVWKDNRIYLNLDGGTQFFSGLDYIPYQQFLSIKLIDIKADGLVDIISQRVDNKWYRWKFDARTNRLTQDAHALNIAENTPPNQLFVVDFNGDGRQDLLEINDSKISWFEQLDVFNELVEAPRAPGDPLTYDRVKRYFAATPKLVSVETDLASYSYLSSSVYMKNADESVRFSDFNGDGVTDLILKVTDASYPMFSSTDKSGHYAYIYNNLTKKLESFAKVGGTGITNITPYDINQDGLTDVMYVSAGKWYYRINRGGSPGFADPVYAGFPASTVESDNSRSIILDYDGNGKVEFWRYQKLNSSTANYYLYSFVDGAFKAKNIYRDIAINPVAVYADIKGNGTREVLVTSEGQSNWKVYGSLNPGSDQAPRANLLTKITGAYGVSTDITYKRLNDGSVYTNTEPKPAYPDIQITTPMPVVSLVKSDTGTVSAGKEVQVSVSYRYEDFRANMKGRGMLGFRKLITTDNQTGIETTTEYSQQFPLTGRPLSTVRRHNNRVLSEATNSWLEKKYGNETFVYLAKSIEKNWTLDSDTTPANLNDNPLSWVNQVITRNEYDNTHGNLLKSTVLNTNSQAVDGSAGTQWFETISVNDYGSSEWEKQYARLKKVTVTKTRSDTATASVQTSHFTYFAETATHNGSEFSGYPGMLKTETSFAGLDLATVNDKALTKEYAYDSFANKTRTIVRAKTRDPFTLEFSNVAVERQAITEYDTSGRFVKSVKNSAGHTETYTYEPRFGGVATQTDPNGLTTSYQYNELGAKTRATAIDGTYTDSESILCGHGATCPSEAVYYTESQAFDAGGFSMSGYQRTFYNRMGLKIVAVKEMPADNGGSRELVSRVAYDKMGKPEYSWSPVFGDVNTLGQHKTQTKYDLLGRAFEVVEPGGRVSSVSHNGLTTVSTNAILQQRSEVKNINGDLLSVTDNAGKTIRYVYDEKGQFKQLTDSLNNSVTNVTDYAGHKVKMIDLDKGTWTYQYNGFGELVRQTDARGVVITQQYDSLGRMIRRVDNAATTPVAGIEVQTSCWQYDTATLGQSVETVKGALHSVSLYSGIIDCVNPGTAVALEQTFTDYDSLARAESSLKKLKAENSNAVETYLTMSSFEQNSSRVELTILPEEVILKNHYDAFGNLIKITDAADETKIYREINQFNQFGNVIKETVGYGAGKITTLRSYQADTGFLNTILASKNTTDLVSLSLGLDDVGNAISRQDLITGRQEVFGYAEGSSNNQLNRITSYTVNGTLAKSYSYDELGNLKSKSDMGDDYRYGTGSAGVHAVTEIYNNAVKKRTFGYDANGNMTSDTDHQDAANNRSIQYSAFDKAVSISKGQSQVTFRYGSSRSRYRRVDNVTENGQPVSVETTYLGSYERVVHNGGAMNGKTEHKYYIAGVAIKTDTETAGQTTKTTSLRYLHKDHLGSVVAISDEAGAVVKRFRYDPFGKQVEVTPSTPFGESAVTRLSDITQRGYTGHEMLNSVDVIHMNGRIYDANIGRFMQADPYIQAPKNLQSMNRYSYVMNNPLTLTDPSGFIFKRLYRASMKLDGRWAAHKFTTKHPNLHSIGITVLNFIPVFGQLAAAHANFDHSFYQTGSLGQAAKSGAITLAASYVSSEAFGAVGNAFKAGTFGNVFGNAMVGGAMSVLQGGKFGHGFMAAGFSAAFKTRMNKIGRGEASYKALRVATAAVIGGTVSRLTGGKFVNGAISSAFSQLYNAEKALAKEKAEKKYALSLKKMNNMLPNEVINYWLSGKGGDLHFGPKSIMSRIFSQSLGAKEFEDALYTKFDGFPKENDFIDNYDRKFTWRRANYSFNVAEQIVGSWQDGIAIVNGGNVSFLINNPMTLKSLLFGRQLAELGFNPIGKMESDINMTISWERPLR